MAQIEFTSPKFLPVLPEDCQVNPGAYGFELAWWLAQTLAKSGVVTSYPVGEDWGWLIEYHEGDAEFMIGCGSQSDPGEGDGDQPVAWSVFVRQVRSLKQRLQGRSAPAIAARLTTAIVMALRAEGIAVDVDELI
ncbi:hypothetical protein G3480_16115 [Thiorhodococcus mannitoliphagus]|uniref:Uncharacterized protein n=1 Tax=Thiorhodococcus mannitoliphagus TaxID=329406 RepID=A0A6P1DYM8_9GAMM|nr:hypothetical protein [Thiorhodococcus mannitoliphagus]NEX21816.1 hypothetical protein [Thiorhodococcus mannitoliphagus]